MKNLRNAAIGAAVLMGAQTALANDNITAGKLTDSMNASDRFTYVSGVVEGLAYGRFLRDTHIGGQNDPSGMMCIHRWFFEDDFKNMKQIEAVFAKYRDHSPAVLLTVLINRKCGE